MENKKSGLAALAEQMPAVKAYKQVAWNINQIKKKHGCLPGADIIAQCVATLQDDHVKNFMKKWKIDLLDFEKPYWTDRYFTMTSLPDKSNEKKAEIIHLLIGSTQPNLNILLELDLPAHRACWLYYDALKEAPFRQALASILKLFLDKNIQHLNLQHVAHRLNITMVRSFFKKNNYVIQLEQPAQQVIVPNMQQ